MITDDIKGALNDIAMEAGFQAQKTVRQAKDTAISEVKKFGKTATTQATGQTKATGGSPEPVGGSQKPNAYQHWTPLGEFKLLGKSMISQVAGNPNSLKGAQLEEMVKTDNKTSEAEAQAIVERIQRMYKERAEKRLQEEEQRKKLEQQQNEQKLEEMEELREKRKQQDILNNPAIAKTRAENKNYGAE